MPAGRNRGRNCFSEPNSSGNQGLIKRLSADLGRFRPDHGHTGLGTCALASHTENPVFSATNIAGTTPLSGRDGPVRNRYVFRTRPFL
jgi:hypothetical protein